MNKLIESYFVDEKSMFTVTSLYGLSKAFGHKESRIINNLSYYSMWDVTKDEIIDHLNLLLDNEIPFICGYNGHDTDLKYTDKTLVEIDAVTTHGAHVILQAEFNKPETQDRIKQAKLMELI